MDNKQREEIEKQIEDKVKKCYMTSNILDIIDKYHLDEEKEGGNINDKKG